MAWVDERPAKAPRAELSLPDQLIFAAPADQLDAIMSTGLEVRTASLPLQIADIPCSSSSWAPSPSTAS